ncbi:MAG: cyclic 2,3-diphosphoglycerate synthase [Polyangiaceae bacterium]
MAGERRRKRTIVVGAAGRDFHNFNVVYRDDPTVEVVAFTATQIPGISGRRYPAALSGPLYPEGIPIFEEAKLEQICREQKVDQVVFSYSDVAHATVMHVASRALAAGADFVLLGPESTMLPSRRPVIAISALRTGCGKSQTSRWLGERLRARGMKVSVIRHPMPYGDLAAQKLERFGTLADMDRHHCTIEEREEYEPHIQAGNLIWAGVDYAAILKAAEDESDIVIWDGGNNDFPFLKPDLHIAIADALRPDQITTHHPGETVVRSADVVVINKVDVAAAADVERVADQIRHVNPRATIVRAASPVKLSDPAAVAGKRVLVIEDGPTITHGGMQYGAGYVAAVAAKAGVIVDPRSTVTPEIKAVFTQYPHIGRVLPAVGYDDAQLEALRKSIEATDADVVVSGTPIDLGALLHLQKPILRARYEYGDAGDPTLASIVDAFLDRLPAS